VTGSERYLIALNFGAAPQALALPAGIRQAQVMLSTAPGQVAAPAAASLALRPNEGLLLRIG
jgi:hypothetical protein